MKTKQHHLVFEWEKGEALGGGPYWDSGGRVQSRVGGKYRTPGVGTIAEVK